MTDPKGRVFISYRRSPARAEGTKEARRLRRALQDRGVPTWRDLEDLANEPTEVELIEALSDSSLSGAVMLVSPEVETSTIIRNVEALRIFRRHSAGDGFFVLPILIGLDYGDANRALGAPAGFQDLSDWNLHKLKHGEFLDSDAKAVADLIVRSRIQRIHAAAADEPFQMGVYSRLVPPIGQLDLRFELSGHFSGRTAQSGSYKAIEAGLVSTAGALLAVTEAPQVHAKGSAALPLGALVGATLSPRAGFSLSWSQIFEGHTTEYWSHSVQPDASEPRVRTTLGDAGSEDLVLAVGVSACIEHAVVEALSDLGIKPRASTYVESETGPLKQGQSLSPESGVRIVLEAISAVRRQKDDLGLKRANVHLFMACPLALAVLLGQKLNTFSTVTLYEHDPDSVPSYSAVHSFNPSKYTYT